MSSHSCAASREYRNCLLVRARKPRFCSHHVAASSISQLHAGRLWQGPIAATSSDETLARIAAKANKKMNLSSRHAVANGLSAWATRTCESATRMGDAVTELLTATPASCFMASAARTQAITMELPDSGNQSVHMGRHHRHRVPLAAQVELPGVSRPQKGGRDGIMARTWVSLAELQFMQRAYPGPDLVSAVSQDPDHLRDQATPLLQGTSSSPARSSGKPPCPPDPK